MNQIFDQPPFRTVLTERFIAFAGFASYHDQSGIELSWMLGFLNPVMPINKTPFIQHLCLALIVDEFSSDHQATSS